MLDKALAVISIAVLVAFVAVLIRFVGETDLTVVTLGVVVLAAIDFYLQTTSKSKDDGRSSGQ